MLTQLTTEAIFTSEELHPLAQGTEHVPVPRIGPGKIWL